MIRAIIYSVVSFILGVFAREIVNYLKKGKHTKYKKVKPLNKQNFKKAMKDLEIK